MKWIKPSGIKIETNDSEATLEYCKSLGWKEDKPEPEVITPKKTTKKAK